MERCQDWLVSKTNVKTEAEAWGCKTISWTLGAWGQLLAQFHMCLVFGPSEPTHWSTSASNFQGTTCENDRDFIDRYGARPRSLLEWQPGNPGISLVAVSGDLWYSGFSCSLSYCPSLSSRPVVWCGLICVLLGRRELADGNVNESTCDLRCSWLCATGMGRLHRINWARNWPLLERKGRHKTVEKIVYPCLPTPGKNNVLRQGKRFVNCTCQEQHCTCL